MHAQNIASTVRKDSKALDVLPTEKHGHIDWNAWHLDDRAVFLAECEKFNTHEKQLFCALVVLCLVVSADVGKSGRKLYMQMVRACDFEARWPEVRVAQRRPDGLQHAWLLVRLRVCHSRARRHERPPSRARLLRSLRLTLLSPRPPAQVLRLYEVFYNGRPWGDEDLLKIFEESAATAPTTCGARLNTLNRQVMDLFSC